MILGKKGRGRRKTGIEESDQLRKCDAKFKMLLKRDDREELIMKKRRDSYG